MPLGRQDVSIARTHSSAHVSGLAGFLGDDELIGHGDLVQRLSSECGVRRTHPAPRLADDSADSATSTAPVPRRPVAGGMGMFIPRWCAPKTASGRPSPYGQG